MKRIQMKFVLTRLFLTSTTILALHVDIIRAQSQAGQLPQAKPWLREANCSLANIVSHQCGLASFESEQTSSTDGKGLVYVMLTGFKASAGR